MILAHKIQLDPTAKQREYFARAVGTARFTWNWALAEWTRQHEAGEKPTVGKLKVQFNHLKHQQFPWISEVHKDANQQPFADLQRAFTGFFKKTAKYPRFKKKGEHDSVYVSNDKFRVEDKTIVLPKIGRVKLTESLRFSGKILSVRVTREADRWSVSIQVDTPDRPVADDVRRDVVGVDLGISILATLSTGEKIEGPKALKKNFKRLQRLSRRHSRKQKGSTNREKSKMNLARLHRRIRNIRLDALHKLTTRLCRENQAVVIEDLHVRGIGNLKGLRRLAADASFGEFRRQLTYKSALFNTKLVIADRWFPSSKRCSACGFVKAKLALGERLWTCESCGAHHDRDINAAINLKQLGQVMPEVTPVERKALALRKRRETGLAEAGTASVYVYTLER